MANANANKGATAERDAARLLQEILGVGARRALGAGRADDVGDIDGVPGFAIQVADRKDIPGTLRHKAETVEAQQANAEALFSVLLMKLRSTGGGRPPQWRFVMTPAQFATVYRALRPYMHDVEGLPENPADPGPGG